MMKIIEIFFLNKKRKDDEERVEAIKQRIHNLSLMRDFDGAIKASNEYLLIIGEGKRHK